MFGNDDNEIYATYGAPSPDLSDDGLSSDSDDEQAPVEQPPWVRGIGRNDIFETGETGDAAYLLPNRKIRLLVSDV